MWARICIAACGIVLAAAMPGCSGKPPVPGQYADARGRFSIVPPDGWQMKEDPRGSGAAFLEPLQGPDDNFRENINIVVIQFAQNVGLAAYAKANDQNMAKLASDYQQVESSAVKLNGQDARRTVFKHKVGSFDLQVLSYLLVKGGRGYVLACTAKADAYQEHEAIFEQACRTFHAE